MSFVNQLLVRYGAWVLLDWKESKMFRLCHRRVLSLKKNELIQRKFATKEANQKVVKYTDTLNLPKTKFPQRLSGSKRVEVEKRLNEVSFLMIVQVFL